MWSDTDGSVIESHLAVDNLLADGSIGIGTHSDDIFMAAPRRLGWNDDASAEQRKEEEQAATEQCQFHIVSGCFHGSIKASM